MKSAEQTWAGKLVDIKLQWGLNWNLVVVLLEIVAYKTVTQLCFDWNHVEVDFSRVFAISIACNRTLFIVFIVYVVHCSYYFCCSSFLFFATVMWEGFPDISVPSFFYALAIPFKNLLYFFSSSFRHGNRNCRTVSLKPWTFTGFIVHTIFL